MNQAIIKELGGVRQFAFVVRHAEVAMAEFANLGVGPFYVLRDYVVDDYRYRGEPAASPRFTFGFAQSGPVQIEVIQQHDDLDSGYKEFLQSHPDGGCHHFALWVDEGHEYTIARNQLLDAGLTVVHENGANTTQARFAYFATDLPGQMVLELGEIPAGTRDLFGAVARAGETWNGEDPIRNFGA